MTVEPPEIRVMLVDDHITLREPLAFMLERQSDLAVSAQASSLVEAKELLRDDNLAVDVAVVDMDLPDGSGEDFIADLRGGRPRATVLVLSALSERERLARAIEAGAAGVMHKSTTRLGDIVEAVRRVYAGEQLLSRQEVSEALRLVTRERQKNREEQRTIGKLSPREREVLQALAEGLSDKEIAQKLYVGVGTIHTHIKSILAKLEVHSRLQALVFAVRHGVVEID